MKQKKFDKKLNLGKKTIAHLNDDEKAMVKGGYFNTNCDATCYTWCAGCRTRPQICGYTPYFTEGPSCIEP
jgi:hypothetical protein